MDATRSLNSEFQALILKLESKLIAHKDICQSGEMKCNKQSNMTLIRFIVILGVLLFSQASSAAERNKTIFISDLHMNIDADYSWLVDHADDVADFLNKVNTRDDVTELVILGDFLDDWVTPISTIPQSFADILSANTNVGIVAALQAICDNPEIKITYVAGNHDMLYYNESQNRADLIDAIPCLHIVSNSQGVGAYSKDDVIWAEHGHRYCLFNAPDTWSRSGGQLPLGYFITRLAASKAATTGQVTTTPDLLDEFLKKPSKTFGYEGNLGLGGIFDDALVIAVFNAIALWSGNLPSDHFTMNGLDGFDSDPSVEDVAITYDTIYSNWPSRQDRVSPTEAIWNDVGALNTAANLLFEMPESLKDKYPFTPRIILFGHTHEAAFQYHSGDRDTIYANTGTWIDGTSTDPKPMTWVEIEITEGGASGKRYEVSLWFHGESSARQSGVIATSLLGEKVEEVRGGGGCSIRTDSGPPGDLAILVMLLISYRVLRSRRATAKG